ncbi:MAG: hypothetical protein ACRD8W_10935 [Nitrososphaeraceae archaeon]
MPIYSILKIKTKKRRFNELNPQTRQDADTRNVTPKLPTAEINLNA